MKTIESTWLIVSDLQRSRLFRAGQSASGNPRLEECDSMTTSWVDSEHGRPSPLIARGVQSYDSREREDLERQRFCARETARWIRQQIKEREPANLQIIAPPRFVDDLSKELDGVDFVQSVAELTNMPHDQLAQHPTVMDWLRGVLEAAS